MFQTVVSAIRYTLILTSLLVSTPFSWGQSIGINFTTGRGSAIGTARPARLYDLEADLGESTNLINDHPNIVKSILALANEAREDLGDRNTKGKGTRPAGLVENPRPLVKG